MLCIFILHNSVIAGAAKAKSPTIKAMLSANGVAPDSVSLTTPLLAGAASAAAAAQALRITIYDAQEKEKIEAQDQPVGANPHPMI